MLTDRIARRVVLPEQVAGLVVGEQRHRAVVLLHPLAQTVVGIGRRAGRREAAAVVVGIGRGAVARDVAGCVVAEVLRGQWLLRLLFFTSIFDRCNRTIQQNSSNTDRKKNPEI